MLPPGRILAVWGQFLKDQLVAISRLGNVVTFCSRDSKTGDLSIILVNKGPRDTKAAVAIDQGYFQGVNQYRFIGKGPEDLNPAWLEIGKIPITQNKIEPIELPGFSLKLLKKL